MNFYVRNSMLLAVAVGLASSSLAMANHRGYRSNRWNSSWNGSYVNASSCSCSSAVEKSSTVEKSAPAPAVAAEAPKTEKERAFSYEPATDANSSNGSNTVAAPLSSPQATQYRSSSNNSSGHSSGTGGNSYDRAMRAKGY